MRATQLSLSHFGAPTRAGWVARTSLDKPGHDKGELVLVQFSAREIAGEFFYVRFRKTAFALTRAALGAIGIRLRGSFSAGLRFSRAPQVDDLCHRCGYFSIAVLKAAP